MRTNPAVLRRACVELGGIARTAQLLRRGVTANELRAAVRSGAIVRVRQGVYALPGEPDAVLRAVAHGGVLGCVDVAREVGLWILDSADHRVHVAMPRNGRARAHPGCACVPHWGGPPVRGGRTSLAAALIDMLGCAGEEGFFVALESAMRRGLLSRAELARIRARVPARHRALVDAARWDADSGLESLLRLRLRRVGIELISQCEIPGVGRVDFVLGDRLILEVDGKRNHVDGFDEEASPGGARAAAASKRHKDLVRDAVAAAHGYDTLRFDYALVVHDWPMVEAAILAKMDRGLHVSPAGTRSRATRDGSNR